MRQFRTFLVAALAGVVPFVAIAGAGQQPPAAPVADPMPAVLQNYQPVTAERLKNPEDGNWLMIRRTYDGWGYSPLDQITPANVSAAAPRLGVLDGRAAASTNRRRSSTTA